MHLRLRRRRRLKIARERKLRNEQNKVRNGSQNSSGRFGADQAVLRKVRKIWTGF